MKKFVSLSAGAAFLAAMLLGAPRADAVSLGLYGSAGGGLAEWDQSGTGRFDDRRDSTHVGYGFVIDTAGSRDLLAYRLGVGYEKIVHEADFDNPRLVLRGIVVDQDLTLDLIGGPGLRLWFGPELRLGAFRGEPDGAAGGNVDFAALGLGPVMGVDYQVGPSLALSWKLGYLLTGYAGTQRDASRYDRDLSIGEGHAYLALSLLFRTWDYERPDPPRPAPRTYYPRY